MKLRLLPIGLLLAVCAYAATGPTPAPWKPSTPLVPAAPQAKPKIKRFVNGVPDTGQFLPDSVWLIRVGPRVTYVGDFVRQYNMAYPEFRPNDDSLGRVEFTNTLINHDLLGLEARRLNRPLDFTDRSQLRETEDRSLSDRFYIRFVVDSAIVRESDVQDFIRGRNEEGHFRRILFADPQKAATARAALVSGKLKWDDAVAQYSLDRPTPQNPNGDQGWVSRGNIPSETGAILFHLKPGEFSPVMHSARGGFEVSQMVEQRKKPPIADDALQGVARATVRSGRIAVIADSIQSVIAHHVGMVFDTANVEYASSHFNKSMQVSRGAYGNNISISGEVPDFSDQDTLRVLARWQNGGYYTLGMFMVWYSNLNPMVRPDVTFPDAMMAHISSIVLEPFRAQIAREKGLDKDPEVIANIEGKREQLMVDHMYQDSVAAGVWVSREERKAYYDAHMSDFVTFPAVDFGMIYRYTRAGADSVKKALDAGAKPWDIIAADSARGEKTGDLQHRADNQKGQYHKILFEELRPGQSSIVGPDRDGVFGVINLVSYDPGRQLSFEESQGMIDESLQNIKAEQRLEAWLTRLKKKYPVVVRRELLQRVLLIDPNDR